MKRFKIFALLAFFALSFTAPAMAQRKTWVFNNDSLASFNLVVNSNVHSLDRTFELQSTLKTVVITTQTGISYTITPKTDSLNPYFPSVKTLRHYLDSIRQDNAIGYSHFCAANTDSSIIASGPWRVTGIAITNHTASIKCVKFYDTSSAPKRASGTGASTACKLHTFTIQANTTLVIPIPSGGIIFRKGIGIRYLGATAYYDNENSHTAATEVPAANDIDIQLWRKK